MTKMTTIPENNNDIRAAIVDCSKRRARLQFGA
jgi:hypothetical protein